jgi:signal transduction histidine kinase
MSRDTPVSLRVQTVSIVAISLLLFHLASLVLYILFSASTVALAREQQLADRIVTVGGFMEGVPASYRNYLASELSGSNFRITITDKPLSSPETNTADSIAQLISDSMQRNQNQVAADYQPRSPGSSTRIESVTTQRLDGLFGIQNKLLVSVSLSNGSWLNFEVSGPAWDQVFSVDAIPSLTLMAIGVILLAAWAVNRPLRTLLNFTAASEAMGKDVLGAQPIDESGPRELRDAAKAFNLMQQRVKRLLQTRNQMLAAVSHDFRTPLTRLRLRAESLGDEQRDKAIKDIEEMEHMIALTLAYAREESTEEPRQQQPLGDLINDLIKTMDCEEHCTHTTAHHNPTIECQPTAVRRALQNVIDNGLKYAGEVQVSTKSSDDGVIIKVDDSGSGIPPEERDKVLLPFYRIESSRNRENGGAGFGLAIAQTVAEAHGGTINLVDSPMGGLQVRISLPGNLASALNSV